MQTSTLQTALYPLREWFLDLVFPKECIGDCGSSSSYFCIDCAWKMDLSEALACPMCGTPQLNGSPCATFRCRNNCFIDQLLVVFDYHKNRIISDAIHIFKYRFAQDLAHNLAILMFKKFWPLLSTYDLVFAPVPLHEKRLSFRGFNQAEVLARELSILCNKPIFNLLKRIKYSKPQAELNGYQRRKNLANTFQITQIPPPKIIVLMDDVFTTGSTLNECAKILKENGATWVVALALARSQS